MTDKRTSTAVATMVGAGLGAAAGAAAVFLSDEKHRKQIAEKANTLKEKTSEAVKTFKQTASDKMNDVTDDKSTKHQKNA